MSAIENKKNYLQPSIMVTGNLNPEKSKNLRNNSASSHSVSQPSLPLEQVKLSELSNKNANFFIPNSVKINLNSEALDSLKIKDKVKEITLKIQKKLNQNNLQDEDFNIFAAELKNNISEPQDKTQAVERIELINKLLTSIVIMARHDTAFNRKINWFGITNQTQTIQTFIQGLDNQDTSRAEPFSAENPSQQEQVLNSKCRIILSTASIRVVLNPEPSNQNYSFSEFAGLANSDMFKNATEFITVFSNFFHKDDDPSELLAKLVKMVKDKINTDKFIKLATAAAEKLLRKVDARWSEDDEKYSLLSKDEFQKNQMKSYFKNLEVFCNDAGIANDAEKFTKFVIEVSKIAYNNKKTMPFFESDELINKYIEILGKLSNSLNMNNYPGELGKMFNSPEIKVALTKFRKNPEFNSEDSDYVNKLINFAIAAKINLNLEHLAHFATKAGVEFNRFSISKFVFNYKKNYNAQDYCLFIKIFINNLKDDKELHGVIKNYQPNEDYNDESRKMIFQTLSDISNSEGNLYSEELKLKINSVLKLKKLTV